MNQCMYAICLQGPQIRDISCAVKDNSSGEILATDDAWIYALNGEVACEEEGDAA